MSSHYTHADWKIEAVKRFGADPMNWRFVCPSCGHIASVADWKALGAPESAVAFSCVGRYMDIGKSAADAAFNRKGGPCNYTGGGFFKLNPVVIIMKDGMEISAFDFADNAHPETAEAA